MGSLDAQKNSLDDFAPTELAPRLKKSGLHLDYPVGEDRNVLQLLQSDVLSREIFDKYGFVVIDNYPVIQEPYYEENLLDLTPGITGNHGDQSLHVDRDIQDVELEYISLRFPPQENERMSYTAVADGETTALRILEFIANNPPPVLRDTIYQLDFNEVADAIRKFGLNDVGDQEHKFFEESKPMTWKKSVIAGRISRILMRSSYLPELNKSLEDITYKCMWQTGRVLIVDNVNMVHGRRNLSPEPRGSFLLRGKFTVDKSGKVAPLE